MSNNENKKQQDGDFDFENVLKGQAEDLLQLVQTGNFSDALRVITELNETRDKSLYREIGRLTRTLHEAIVNFHIDAGGTLQQQEEMSEISDASDRLAYVVNLTSNAANRTMDLVEASMPLATEMKNEAHSLRGEWHKLARRQLTPDDFRVLYKRIDLFLNDLTEKSDQVCTNLSDILLAQGFQDLTGQVIQKVTTLVREVEDNLVRLVAMAGKVDQMTGIHHDISVDRDVLKGEGPQISKVKKPEVVSGQDDVDDLLSSLGF
jgi:chemotaxis protein CheZ